MNSSDLSKLLSDKVLHKNAKSALFKYVKSFFPYIFVTYERYQEIIDKEFPEHWSGTVCGDDHLAQLFDRLRSFELTNDELHVWTRECFHSEYDYKVAVFSRNIFDETDDIKRNVLIDVHFATLANIKRAEYQVLRTKEEAEARIQYEQLKERFERTDKAD